MGIARAIAAALKNAILSDDQRKSEPLCIASLYRMAHSGGIPRSGRKAFARFSESGFRFFLPCDI